MTAAWWQDYWIDMIHEDNDVAVADVPTSALSQVPDPTKAVSEDEAQISHFGMNNSKILKVTL